MAMENKRITQLSTERLNLTSGDYVMVDDADNGSAKYRLDRLKETDTTLSVSGMAADAAATGQAISDETEARENADSALGEDIGDLKSAMESAEADIENVLQTKAPVIINSATGQIVTFSDGADGMNVKSLKVNMEPIQDLHGYDHPWPAGGGKNLLHVTGQSSTSNGITYTVNEDGTITATGTATANSALIVTYNANLGAGNYIINGCPQGGSSTTYRLYFEWNDDSLTHGEIDTGSGETINNATSIGRFTIQIFPAAGNVNLTFKPMIRLASESDATFAPYSNICPISGLDEVEVKRTGKNLLHVTAQSQTVNGVTFTVNEDGTVVANGTASAVVTFNLTNGFIPFQKGTYVISGTAASGARVYANPDKTTGYFDGGSGSNAFTVATELVARIQIESGTVCDNLVFHPMIRHASDADPTFVPYQGQEVTESLPETVYGGTLDLETGELTVDKGYVEYDGSETWSMEENTSQYAGKNFYTYLPSGIARYGLAKSNFTNNISPYTIKNNVIYISGGFLNFIFGDLLNIDTIEGWKNYLASNKIQIVYTLTTPITYTLTPQQLETVKGINHISANGNTTIDVDYCADTKLYIDQKLATAIANALNA